MPSLSDLLRMGKQYIGDALPGGSLNPEMQPIADLAKYIAGGIGENSPMNRDLQSWHGKTQRGLSDLIAGNEGPQADYGYAQMMNMAGVAPVGMTAWHGSPHKFDKFSLDKIGTGEGAQAYGHGLYLAESPEVAQSYKNGLSNRNQTLWRDIEDVLPDALKGKAPDFSDAVLSGKKFDDLVASVKPPFQKALLRQNKDKLEGIINSQQSGGALYKTDIPDEAVARFLDWDKPLSQDSPQAFKDAFNKLHETYPALKEQFFQAFRDKRPGNHYYSLLNDYAKTGDLVKNQTFATDAMREAGIPGIRYLDGGSRSAGQGSSNFVVFDPEMIRILERNGVPTGQKPWNPNEYRPLSDLMNPRID